MERKITNVSNVRTNAIASRKYPPKKLKSNKNPNAENLGCRRENQGGRTEASVELAKIGEDREAVCFPDKRCSTEMSLFRSKYWSKLCEDKDAWGCGYAPSDV